MTGIIHEYFFNNFFSGASIAGTMYSVEELKIRKKPKCSYINVASQFDQVDGAVTTASFSARQEKKIHQFLMALCLCHSAQVAPREELKDGDLFYGCSNESFISDEDDVTGNNLAKYEYNAASPDEKAILEGCSYLGMKYAGEDEIRSNCKVLDMRSETASLKTYKKLHTMEFDSERKRMSVIVRHPNGKIYLITKGADSSVIPRCSSGPVSETGLHIQQWAVTGSFN